MRTPYLVCCSALVLLLALPVLAEGFTPPLEPGQGLGFQFTGMYGPGTGTTKPGTRTGFRFAVGETPPNRDYSSAGLRQVTVTLPQGTRINTAVAPECRVDGSFSGTFGASCLSSAVGQGVIHLNGQLPPDEPTPRPPYYETPSR